MTPATAVGAHKVPGIFCYGGQTAILNLTGVQATISGRFAHMKAEEAEARVAINIVNKGLAIKARLLAGWRFLRYLYDQFDQNQGTLNAGALTYTTLFAVVPMMTVTYAMLSSIPSFQGVGVQLEDLIFNHFVPSSGIAVKEYLAQFASQARTLTAVGVGFLIVTAYMMLKTIETAFNRIWRVNQPRQGLSSFLLYWAILSLGPLLLGLGFVLTSYLVSLPLISDATEVVGKAGLLKLVPLLTSTAAFTLIYAAVPNCPVVVRHAFIGGLVVALVFEAAKQAFTLFVKHFPSYELIYGAFAAVPMFLAWVFISWLIVLLGAELVRALSHYRADLEVSRRQRLCWLLLILEQCWLAQRYGQPMSQPALLKALEGLAPTACDDYLNQLLETRVVGRTEAGEFLLTRDLHRFSLLQLCELLPRERPSALDPAQSRPWMSEVEQRLEAVSEFRQQRLEVDLATLFSADPRPLEPVRERSGGLTLTVASKE